MAPTVLLVSYRRPVTRSLYLFFGIIGGFFYSDIVTRTVKRIWWVVIGVSTGHGLIIGPAGYLLTATELLLVDLMYTGCLALCHMYSTVYTPLVTYYFRDVLKGILRDIDDELGCAESEAHTTTAKHHRYNSVVVARNWLAWIESLMAVLTFSRPVYSTLVCVRDCLGKQGAYSEATPLTQNIHSLGAYLVVSLGGSCHILYASSIPICAVIFGLMITYEFYNASVNLSVRLKHIINDAATRWMGYREQSRTRPKSEQIESARFEAFKADMAFIVQRYHAIIRTVERIRNWIQILCSVNLLNFFFIETMFAYLALDSEYEPILRVQAVAGFLAMATLTYGICLIGKIFEDITESLSTDIYFTLWFELPPKHRKMIHIFQAQLQRPIRFYAFLVYPVTMVTFARALRFVYSIISLTRTLI